MKTRNSKKQEETRNIVIIGKTSNEERKYHRRAEDKESLSGFEGVNIYQLWFQQRLSAQGNISFFFYSKFLVYFPTEFVYELETFIVILLF